MHLRKGVTYEAELLFVANKLLSESLDFNEFFSGLGSVTVPLLIMLQNN